MPSPAEVIREILVRDEFAAFPGITQQPDDLTVQCFTKLPDTPDNVLVVTDQAGLAFGRIQRGGKSPSHPGVKVVVRHLDEQEGYDFLARVVHYLQEVMVTPQSVLVRGVYCNLQSAYRTGDIIALGEEPGTKRYLWSYNMRVAMMDVTDIPLPL